MLRLERCADFNVSVDPVWPDLPMSWRIENGREVYSYVYKGEIAAVICVAFCSTVPANLQELSDLSGDISDSVVAVPYTVWSNRKGFGRSIVLALIDRVKNTYVERVVTMSPKTEMAYNFHIANGAKQIARNPESDNYEYSLDPE